MAREVSNWTQTEQAHGLEKGQLKAILAYSDRSWTNVDAYGSLVVGRYVRERELPWGKSQVTSKATNELPKAIPADQGWVHDGSEWGLKEEGKVLLVAAELLR